MAKLIITITVPVDEEHISSIAGALREITGKDAPIEELAAAVKHFVDAGLSYLTQESELLSSTAEDFLNEVLK